MTVMKRSREVEAEAMANCALMLLSTSSNGFECKTCNKRFPSFQALGGHRASHKRPKSLAGAGDFLVQSKKNKMHECCSMEFSLGQALGGHMRRHRDEVAGKTMIPVLTKSNSSKRIFCGLDLDLNLTPDVDVELKLWPKAPVSSHVLRIFYLSPFS